MLPQLTLLLALIASSTGTAGPCELVDRATVNALLGAKSSTGMPAGPERDEDSSGMVSYCIFRAGSAALILSQVTFSSAAEAGKATTKELVTSRMDGDGAKITDEPGLGDRAYWAYTTEGAEIVVLKGSVVLGVALGGQLANPPVSYRKALRAAAAAALLKL
ncbi:MAG: hypothetical protein ABJC19_07460 [Gemmatimonadota bacterium]